MSAFLGPIHYWLYHKIQFQDLLVKELAFTLGNEEIVNVDTKIGGLPSGQLEDIIDTSNIHGWLQEKIHLVECRLSYMVEALCNKGVSMERIGEVVYEFGKKKSSLTKEATAIKAYKLINDTLLDGMPCDHVNVVKVQEQDRVEWVRTQNLHEDFWNQDSIKENRYDCIRDQVIRGLLAATKLSYHNENNQVFQID